LFGSLTQLTCSTASVISIYSLIDKKKKRGHRQIHAQI
jgi:hypothetical protein